jgi:phosphoribosylaminoimidazole carboxylase (NCAIR synthetase)
MIGGGQLARMTHQAAIALGQTLRVLAATPDDPAAQVTPDVVLGAHTDIGALRRVAAGADALTFDHEHVPTSLLEELVAEGVKVAPPPDALIHAQDKLVMRRRLEALGAPVPRFAEVTKVEDVDAFAARIDGPIVVKTVRGGYDGRGVTLARDVAEALGLRLADELGVVGVLAVELFETTDGGLLVNELAMRPHNSGHWTMDGARTSQFEQHLRAVLDYPLGATRPIAPVTVMANVLGAPHAPAISMDERLHHLFARIPDAKVHLYGKAERPGRKIGHVNLLGEADGSPADDEYVANVRELATRAAHYLSHGEWTDGWDEHGG